MRTRIASLLILSTSLLAAACQSTLSTACNDPDTRCSDTLCVDTHLDPHNCGGCGNACLAGFVCDNSQCTCPAGAACDPAACKSSCTTGQSCLPDEKGNGACFVGDLFPACFQAGTVVAMLKTGNVKSGSQAMGIDGPQSLASLQDGKFIVALGSRDDSLYVIDRSSMTTVGSVVFQTEGGSFPDQVLTRGSKAYVIKSGVATVEVIDLTDPTKPAIAGEVSTGTGSNPEGAGFDDAGNLWVSLWLTGQLTKITFDGSTGTAGTPIDLPDVGAGGRFPTGVAVFGDQVYVTLNHLDTTTFAPVAPGYVAVAPAASGTAAPVRVSLGDECLNPGFVAKEGVKLWIACTGTYGVGDGEVVALDTGTNEVVTRVKTGGAPARLSVDPETPGHLYAADAASGGIFEIHPDGTSTKVDVCGSAAMEFVGDVLVF